METAAKRAIDSGLPELFSRSTSGYPNEIRYEMNAMKLASLYLPRGVRFDRIIEATRRTDLCLASELNTVSTKETKRPMGWQPKGTSRDTELEQSRIGLSNGVSIATAGEFAGAF